MLHLKKILITLVLQHIASSQAKAKSWSASKGIHRTIPKCQKDAMFKGIKVQMSSGAEVQRQEVPEEVLCEVR